MQAFAPFEPEPVLAVAVSGGPDSMALCLLADRWARARGGRIEAVTVDHRLRPESAAEARQVRRWLKPRGIVHRTLVWTGAKPTTGIPDAARAARYRLLVDAAARRGILHLLLAHHLDDQAETLLLRLGRGSGVDGLAAMAGEVALPALRLLRPLLGVPKLRLIATLDAMNQGWVEDPGNRTTATARGRVRHLLAADGIDLERLGETAARLGRARAALEAATSELMARGVVIHPAGYLVLDPAAVQGAPEELRLRVLARALMTISGNTYPPRLERLERLERSLFGAPRRGHTLHGCRILQTGKVWLICREPGAVAPPQRLQPGENLLWDGRFQVTLALSGALSGWTVGALGEAGWRAVTGAGPKPPIPRPAGLSLPAFSDRNGLVLVPHLRWNRADPNGRAAPDPAKIFNYSTVFVPGASLSPPAFAVAPPPGRTM